MKAELQNRQGYEFFDLEPTTDVMREEVIAGLRSDPKHIAPKFFYDEQGSELFEAITRLPEYYLTRTEMALFDRHEDQIAQAMGGGGCLVEYGSGSSAKIRKLLKNVRPKAYVPVDISRDHLQDSSRQLHDDFPWLQIYPVCADFTEAFALPERVQGLSKVGFFPGSSIGNFRPDEAVDFLVKVIRTLGPASRFLVGVDTKKSTEALEAAYNDSQGLTAQFNENMLQHLNVKLQADFDVDQFTHQARYNEDEGCIQMFLESSVAQTANIGSQQIHFAQGETVHTENSYKYHPAEFEALATEAGFQVKDMWTDERRWFGVYLLETVQT
ncbi:MAG: L-histidine N(alpha)-methyltransferase [Pseudomonadales bacterium]